jgi:hypothetical protein
MCADGNVIRVPHGFFVAVAEDDPRSSVAGEAMHAVAKTWTVLAFATKGRPWASPFLGGFAVTGSMQDCSFISADGSFAEADGWSNIALR